MAEEMIESVPWESEEAEYPEADEAIAEAEDSGEAHRRSRRSRSAYHPARGVQGMTLRGRDGSRSLQFPAKLATAEEMNRGLANQELARRGLDERLDRLERKFRGQQKNDVATTGAVSLAIAGGLSVLGAFKAVENNSSFSMNGWATEEVTEMASVVSATQLATSTAKLAVNGRYIRSGLGITADAFSVVQLALFAYGYLSGSAAGMQTQQVSKTEITAGLLSASNFTSAAGTPISQIQAGTQIYDLVANEWYVVINASGVLYVAPIPNPA
jgi:hypothetical protein